MTTSTKDRALNPDVVAEEVALSLGLIDPDPDQPRLEVDDELAGSIASTGVLKAIEVRPHPENADRYMIVDGERRWRGAKKAGLKTIPAKLTFAVEGIAVADRLVRQIIHNTGRPLTPLEEALAFKKIIDDRRADKVVENAETHLKTVVEQGDKKYGPVALARELGIAKSTVTDRLAATEIPRFWLKLIVSGPLQVSHVPLLHRYRDVPEKYQLRALEKIKGEHGFKGLASGERLPVEDFRYDLEDAMAAYLRPLKDVAGYKGPTAKLPDKKSWPRRDVTMALDPTLWEPILRKKISAKRKATQAAGGTKGKATKQADKWRQQQEAQTKRYAAEQRRVKQYEAAKPAVIKAIAERVNGSSLSDLRDFLTKTVGERGQQKKAAGIIAAGTTAEQLVRHLALLVVVGKLGHRWEIERQAKALGRTFDVDITKIVKADEDEPAAAEVKAPVPADEEEEE